MLWQVCVVLFVIWMAVNRWKNRKLIRLSKQLKTEATWWPFVGHAYKFIGSDQFQMNGFHSFGDEAIRNGGLTSFWMGDLLFVLIADPDVAEIVLKTFLAKSELLRFVREVIGNGSIFAPVQVWRPRRKILAPTFSPKNLNQYLNNFVEQSAIMAGMLESKVGTGSFSVWKYLTTYTMDSVCESTLGVKVEAQKDHKHPFLKYFVEASRLAATRMINPWLHSDVIYKLLPAYQSLQKCKKYLHGFVDDIVKLKREAMESDKTNTENGSDKKIPETNFKTFLELLIESSGGEKGYSDVELREEILVLVMAGTDTSAVGSAFTILMMARHPNVQEKVFQELQDVFGDSTRPVTAEDLPRLRYMEAVIKETLRLYPPVPLTVRHCDKDYTLPSGVTLVTGSVLLLNIWAIHRNAKYWGEDVKEFKPERFLDAPLIHPAQFMAFSYGPRNCLGYQYAMMSMKTALATLLRRYRVLPCAGARKHLRLKYDIMMKDVDNFKVQIEKR